MVFKCPAYMSVVTSHNCSEFSRLVALNPHTHTQLHGIKTIDKQRIYKKTVKTVQEVYVLQNTVLSFCLVVCLKRLGFWACRELYWSFVVLTIAWPQHVITLMSRFISQHQFQNSLPQGSGKEISIQDVKSRYVVTCLSLVPLAKNTPLSPAMDEMSHM